MWVRWWHLSFLCKFFFNYFTIASIVDQALYFFLLEIHRDLKFISYLAYQKFSHMTSYIYIYTFKNSFNTTWKSVIIYGNILIYKYNLIYKFILFLIFT